MKCFVLILMDVQCSADAKESNEPFAAERNLQLSGRMRNVDKDIDAWAMNMRKVTRQQTSDIMYRGCGAD